MPFGSQFLALPSKSPEQGYHLTEDLVDRAIEFVADAKQVAPEKPLFLYFARAPCTRLTTCFLEHTDHHIGRLVDFLAASGQLETR